MRVLAIDTASPLPTVAVVSTELEAELPILSGAAENLVRCARELLALHRLTVADLGAVAAVSGPGSFTGLRAGIAFARGLARAREVPFLLGSTFRAASAALPAPARLDLLLDAGRGDVYRARRRGGALEEEPSPLRRDAALEEAGAEGCAIFDLDAQPRRLAVALGRLAVAGALAAGDAPRYGRPSAAEEKMTAPGAVR